MPTLAGIIIYSEAISDKLREVADKVGVKVILFSEVPLSI
jgi:hypothetical protein